MKWIASFPGFTWPKTTLAPETERGLTSEFGMGSGGSHTLWPATQLTNLTFAFLMFRLLFKKCIYWEIVDCCGGGRSLATLYLLMGARKGWRQSYRQTVPTVKGSRNKHGFADHNLG